MNAKQLAKDLDVLTRWALWRYRANRYPMWVEGASHWIRDEVREDALKDLLRFLARDFDRDGLKPREIAAMGAVCRIQRNLCQVLRDRVEIAAHLKEFELPRRLRT